ncbi:NAD(P)/FAD-dependent oxidoreductase [uncultured Microbacterium sp.]|uniref:Protoporphyrinogen oxidase n=1 Tax=uncultured Microbacterium sp. TaxID=191216 RepID=A0A1Y5P1E0_9MICO|nr:FAD-dependent oxidoreductase [uncultured Microbacterium sp.]SBS72494.1 Protoporphyrinogen oxidase [uncultured Microbacterium sp.]
MTDPASGLVARARDARVVVVGGGLAGLVAALECAKVGIGVTLVEAADRVGGGIVAADLGGVAVDVGADSFDPPEGAFRALLEDLGLSGDIVAPAVGALWVAGLPAGLAPLPRQSIVGIPANPFADDVRRIIGWRGAWRAYLDRLRPPLTIGHARSLGALVRARMGDRVVDRMVAPAVRARFGVDPDRLEIDAAIPGLNGALTRAGSLSGAVAELLASTPDGTPRAALRGGMTRLVDALQERLADLGVTVTRSTRVRSIAGTEDGWLVACDTRTPAGSDGEMPAVESPAIETPDELRADAVILATDEAEARRLLRPHVDLPAADAPTPGRDDLALLVDATALGAPQGIAAAVLEGTVVRDATAEWPWLAEALGPTVRLLRVTLPADGGDSDPVDRALRAASTVTGAPLTRAELRGAHRVRWVPPSPAAAIDHAATTVAIRRSVHAVGLAVVGGWLSGGDPAQVAEDAVAEADRVRAHALWGTPLGHSTH